MKRIAITGGMGSGKSYVCRLLESHGIDVYDCDRAAKHLMATSPDLQRQLCQLAGNDVYRDGQLQKSVLAKFLLQSDEHKQAVDDVVHPAVARHYLESGKAWLESAILFDSGFYRRVHFDVFVCVSAPLQLRVERIMQRDNISSERAMQWIARQMSQEEVERRCHHVLVNDGTANLQEQIRNLLSIINNNG